MGRLLLPLHPLYSFTYRFFSSPLLTTVFTTNLQCYDTFSGIDTFTVDFLTPFAALTHVAELTHLAVPQACELAMLIVNSI